MLENAHLPSFEQAVLRHLDAAHNHARWLTHNNRDAEDVVVLQDNSGTLMRKALEKLPLNFREVLVLRELEGMTYREIADITGMPTGTVMSSLSRARGRLRQALTGIINGNTAPNSRRIAAVNT